MYLLIAFGDTRKREVGRRGVDDTRLGFCSSCRCHSCDNYAQAVSEINSGSPFATPCCVYSRSILRAAFSCIPVRSLASVFRDVKTPLSAVCANGYRRMSAGQLCVSCEGGWSNSAKVALWLLVVAAPLALVALVVFLVGGPPAVLQVSFRRERGEGGDTGSGGGEGCCNQGLEGCVFGNETK